jgi:CheY-like chemotaxis protein
LLKTILLAEDSPDDQILFLRVLRQAGVENPVFIVHDGDEALSYLKGEGSFTDRERFPLPCALFLDLRMRRVDGWEVLRWLRTQDEFSGMLVVVLTVFDEPKTILEAYRLGANSFLTKPIWGPDVKNLVQYFRSALMAGQVKQPA